MQKENLRDLIISDNELCQLTGMSNLMRVSDLKNISSEDTLKTIQWKECLFDTNNNNILRPSIIQDKSIEHFINKSINDTPFLIVGGASSLFALFPTFILPFIWTTVSHSGVSGDTLFSLWVLSTFAIFCIFKISNKLDTHKKLKKSIPTRLGILLDEVDKYNVVAQEIINQIEAFDQLAAIGHAVTLNHREEVLTSFQQIRSDLVRALQTERILREKNIRPEQFSVEFVPMNSLEFHGEVQQIAKIVNDATEIGLTVQEEMRKLCVPEDKELQAIDR